MSSLAKGFGIGFANTLSDNIQKRKSDADDYYNKQLEIAQTYGVKNRVANNAKMQESVSLAKQLVAKGVPQNVVMAIANQNPEDLSGFASTVQKLQMEGVDTTPEFFEGLVEIHGELDTGGRTLEQLFKDIYGPISNNAKANPEAFKEDPKGSLLATIMGYNAQEKAVQRLEDTEVMDGYTAGELLRAENAGVSKPLGDTTVTINDKLIGDTIRSSKGKERDVRLEMALNKEFQERIEEERIRIGVEPKPEEVGDLTPEEFFDWREKEAIRRAQSYMFESYGSAAMIPSIVGASEVQEDTSEGEVEIRKISDNGETSTWRIDGVVVSDVPSDLTEEDLLQIYEER